MGTGAPAKRSTHRMKEITNYQLQITNLNPLFRCSLFLCVLCALAGNSPAQIEPDILIEKINRGNTERKRDALAQIRNLRSESASRIAVSALKDSSEIVRASAAFSVIYLPKNEAVRNLVPLLQDKSALVRRETAYALGKVGASQAVNPLLQILQKDKVLEVRNAAIVALGEIGDAAAVAELTKILQRKPQAKEEFARRSAARSIGQIAQIIQTNAVEVLTPESFLPDRDKSVEKPIYLKLIETFPTFRAAINVLIQTLQNSKDSDDAKREAAFALGAIGDESAIPILQANTGNEDYYLAEIARESLRKISFNLNQKDGINILPDGIKQ
ncbi:MAG: HEAT repeat domain-containing protein [Acidobacteria bacterium]|nr:HEAT repeat domain-containing protein [Acidobacteriota bacterium]